LAATAVLFFATLAQAGQGLGEAVAVIDVTTASGQIGERQLATGSKVFVGDRITTNATGEAQIRFSDGTRMVVGPQGSLLIEELLIGESPADNRFAVETGAGTFRFLSGDTDDRGYRIRTAHASLAVRGTAIDLSNDRPDGTWMILLKGGADLCVEGGECAGTRESCGVLRTDAAGRPEALAPGEAGAEEIARRFPYVNADGGLLEPFRVTDHDCGVTPAGGDPTLASERAQGGVSQFALDGGPSFRLPPAAAGAAAAIVAGAGFCLLGGCDPGGGGGGPTITVTTTTGNGNGGN
jgi:hypothetical protein